MNADYIDLPEAARRTPGRPHVASLWRWMRRGVKVRSGERVTLNHIRVGGKLYTTEADLAAFFAEVSEADRAHFNGQPDPPPRPQTDRQRERSIERAEAVLAKGGIL